LNLRKITFAASVLLLLMLSSCGTVRRAGKDFSVAALSWAVIPYGAATDAYATAQDVRDGLGAGATTQVFAAIPAFLYHAIKHTIYVGVHVVDFVLFPAYGAAELHPYGPDIQPLDIYTGTWFDTEPGSRSGTDAQTGETAEGGR
jgi:predicted small secreted protein